MKVTTRFAPYVCAVILSLFANEALSQEAHRAPSNVNVAVETEGLSRSAVAVAPETTVVWVNRTGHPLKVRFPAPGVSTTCKDPKGFPVHERGITSSVAIPDGEVASLCFLERKTYQYEVDVFPEVSNEPEETLSVRTIAGSVQVR